MKTLLCFFCFSLTGWVWMAIEFVKLRRFKARVKPQTVSAKGIIVGYEKKPRNWGRSVIQAFYPIIRFQSSSGEYCAAAQYSYPELPNFTVERPPEGSEIELLYDPKDPSRFHLKAEESDKGIGHFRLGFLIIGISAVASILCAIVAKW